MRIKVCHRVDRVQKKDRRSCADLYVEGATTVGISLKQTNKPLYIKEK